MATSETFEFRVPFEEPQPSLETLLARAWPELSEETIEEVFERTRVQIGKRPIRRLDDTPRPEGLVEIEVSLPAADSRSAPTPATLARGDDWIVVDKPVGMPGRLDPDDPMHPIHFLADRLGLEREALTSVWPMPLRAGGPWLFGTSPEAAEDLRADWRSGDLMITWVVLVPRPDMPSGTLQPNERVQIQYSATNMQEGLAELQLIPRWIGPNSSEMDDDISPLASSLQSIAEAGFPALGDRRRGGYMVPGGLRMRLAALVRDETDLQHSWQTEEPWWPEAPVRTPLEEREPPEPDEIDELDAPELVVTPETIDRLRSDEAHPWIRADAVIGRRGSIRPGTLIRLRDSAERPGPTALFEGTSDRAARIWSEDPLEATDFEGEVELRFDEAIARRGALLRRADRVEHFRLVHGEADGLPGLALDRIGPLLRAEVTSPICSAFKEELYTHLRDSHPETMLLEVDATSEGGTSRQGEARLVHTGAHYLSMDDTVCLRERNWQYRLNPWRLEPRAVDPAHRGHRRRLAEFSEADQRWLDDSPASTAFATILAASGAHVTAAVSSEEAEARIRARFELNGVGPGDHLDTIGSDALPEWLESGEEVFDGVALEWRETPREPARVRRLLTCLEPGGRLLVYRTETDSAEELRDRLTSIAETSEYSWARIETIDLPIDFPALPNVSEGPPRGALAELDV